MLDIKYDFGLLRPPALVIVMQVKQYTPSHALHLLCHRDSFMISNQCQVFLLIWLHMSVCACSLFACICTSKRSSVLELAANWRATVSDALQQVLSRAGRCNLYLTLVRIIIQHLPVQFQDSGQLKLEMLLKDAGAIKQKTLQYPLSSSCESTHKSSPSWLISSIAILQIRE